MQQVTLLRPREIFQLGVGSQAYKFFQGIPVSVPDEIAERLSQERGPQNKQLFKIEPVGGASDPDADVAEALGVQLKFKAFSG